MIIVDIITTINPPLLGSDHELISKDSEYIEIAKYDVNIIING
jgi:hypothetical protein